MNEVPHVFMEVLWLHVTMGLAAAVAVGLRFYARKLTKAKLQWDDWIIVAAVLFVWGDAICTIIEYRPYIRRVPKAQLPIKDQTELMVVSFISIVFTVFAEVVTRFSVIYLYYRLFSVKRWLHYSLIADGVISIIWLFAVIFASALECKPIKANFDASIKGKCLNTQSGFFISELLNMLLDLALIAMPIPIILKLKLPLRERVAIAGIFMTGGLQVLSRLLVIQSTNWKSSTIVTSVLRLVKGYNPDGDTSITGLSHLSIWTGLHLGFAIICACLPVFRVYIPRNGLFSSKMRLVYTAVSGWVGRSSSHNKSTASLPKYMRKPSDSSDNNKDSQEFRYAHATPQVARKRPVVDEILLTTVCSVEDRGVGGSAV
ncbi:integral membrane protein [Sclerotinia borealis F-4128]|uniref:Integral membrane protein n=1 Tax=Sclerotinia borealis (strain F-4128) TaxID=1432307 RepID=W9C5X8_SCLBF|nr:integral membrane protein [Sclerotinia borealis F-4128]